MKRPSSLILLFLIPSLFLTACGDSGGFSSGSKSNSFQEDNTSQNNEEQQEVTHGGGSGSGGEENESHQNENENENQNTSNGEGNEGETSNVDLGTLITNFRTSFVRVNNDNYINLSYVKDPFAAEYQFSYYTINEEKLEQSSFIEKETIDSNETYKLFLGSSEPGTYIIKYFNKSGKQYGTSEFKIKPKYTYSTNSYLAVSFNLIQVRFYAIGYNIQQHFKKIGDFFNDIFNQDHIRI